ncbi:hypothetical protein PUN28_013221 [Cardiocondyla obscurior]|uniref:Uncharacterized protein n=1 Tax=Cardiocondyla obscurior TaxID=286306 RepID=A0AAW2FBH3_9HYME
MVSGSGSHKTKIRTVSPPAKIILQKRKMKKVLEQFREQEIFFFSSRNIIICIVSYVYRKSLKKHYRRLRRAACNIELPSGHTS